MELTMGSLNGNLITSTMTVPDHLIGQAFSIVKRREKIRASFSSARFSSLEEKQAQFQALVEVAITSVLMKCYSGKFDKIQRKTYELERTNLLKKDYIPITSL